MFNYAWPPAKKQAENINSSHIVTCQGLYLENMGLSHTCLVYLKSLVILLLSLFVILLVYQWSLAIVINFSFFSSLLLPLVVFSCT